MTQFHEDMYNFYGRDWNIRVKQVSKKQETKKIIMNWIKTNGAIQEVLINKEERLDKLQELVGGYIELVYLADNKVMVVNEEGLIHGLPYNHTASMIAKQDIVGNVVVCNRNEIN